MLYEIPTSFIVRCQEEEQNQFLVACRKLFHAKLNPIYSFMYIVIINQNKYDLVLNSEDPNNKELVPLIFLSDEDRFNYTNKNPSQLVVHICLTDQIRDSKFEKNIFTLYYPSISLSTVESFMTYITMLNDCFPYGLHQRGELSHDCCILLKHLFRSLDDNFKGKIPLSTLSLQNFNIFGVHLSAEDYYSIFQIIREGDEPKFIDAVRTMTISFDEFLQIMQHLKSSGYGHVIYLYMFSTDYYKYMNPCHNYEINGQLLSLSDKAFQFIKMLYNEFQELPSPRELIEMFLPNGGAPQRLTNLKHISEEVWVEMWEAWFRAEPYEVARNLLAFGFPISDANQPFNIKQEQNVSPVTIGIACLTGLAATGGFMLMKMKKKL